MTKESKRPLKHSKHTPNELTSAIEAVRKDLGNQALWDEVEDLAETSQKPEEVSALFLAILEQGLEPSLVFEIGQRALRFVETWFGEESRELPELLERILKTDPDATWAFQRLTVAYTVAERWNELLELYDRAIASTDETARRMQLLDEAAHAAKDFAAQPDRAIDYLTKAFSLDPSNNSLAASLERLLERQERWRDLLEMWRLRLAFASAAQARELRLRRATILLDKLSQASEALTEVKFILEQAADREAGYGLLEKIVSADAVQIEQRREAFGILKTRYLEARSEEDLVRILEVMLVHVSGEERDSVLRELTDRLVGLGQEARAMEHRGAQFLLSPNSETRGFLRGLAERSRRFDRYVDYLVQAAAGTESIAFAIELWTEGARVREEMLNDKNGAIELYQMVLGAKPTPQVARDAGHRLIKLFEEVGRDRERFEVLNSLVEIEADSEARAALLGQAAHLADRLGEQESAQQAWLARFAINKEDVEAIDAIVASLESQKRWSELIEMLRKRVVAPVPAARRRKDLVSIAGIYSDQLNSPQQAIEIWREIERDFGKDADSVAALVELLSKAERWPELAEVLEEAASNATAGFADIQVKLGDAYRERLGRTEQAVACYRKALQSDPRHAQARAGMFELLSDDRVRRTVVESLTTAFSESGEWQKKLEILEHRLVVADGVRQKIDILVEAADLCLHKQDNPAAALTSFRRALPLAPEDRDIEKEVRRLGELLGAWQVVVDAYRETLVNVDPAAGRTADLQYQRGSVLEEQLGDKAGALQAYLAAAAVSPDRLEIAQAAVRVASNLGRWKEVAKVTVALFSARGKIDAALLAAIESAASAADAFDGLTKALTDVLDAAADLAPALARDLYTRVGIWHRDRRNDGDTAEVALSRAVARDSSDPAPFRILAELQRRAPSVALTQTLLQIASFNDQNLDPLFEAGEVAKVSNDLELERSVLQRLYTASVSIWSRGKEASGERSARSCASFAVERLVESYLESDQRTSAVKLLVEAAALPFGLSISQQMRHRAAETAAEVLRDIPWATEIFREILDRDPTDLRALARLADLYRHEDRLFDLVGVRQQELRLDVEPKRRLELRLDLVDVFGALQARVDRIKLLTTNLQEQPGHAPSIEALSRILAGSGQYADLATMLRGQAEKVETGKEPPRAAALWLRVGELCESKLSDEQNAINAYQKHFALEPSAETAARLAHLYNSRGQYAVAAEWSRRRLETASGAEQGGVALELAKAYLQAGSVQSARTVLEKTLGQDPAAQPVRDLLADLLRRESAWEPLAGLLSEGANHVSDSAAQLAYLKEAVDIYLAKLNQPQAAIPSLQRAVALTPGKSSDALELSVKLAESLRDAGRIDEARQVLHGLIDGFGRRRGPERANIHFLLAGIENAAGDVATCFTQLEAATKMDLSHTGALQMTGELARKQGDLERAERAYRALLMLLRRQPPSERDALGPAEVLFELYGIAQTHGRADQARELMESAFETALQSEAEARRFQQALRRRGEPDLVLRFVDIRLKNPLHQPAEAEILATRADVLVELGREAEALDDRIRALTLDPDADSQHQAIYQLAVRVGQLPRYLDCLSALADSARRRRGKDDNLRAAKLTLRLGQIIEKDLGDFDRAASLYAKVESSGELVEEAWLALARIAGARGDKAEQRRVIERIVALEDNRVSPQFRADAFYQLAEMEFGQESGREAGIIALSRALDLEPRYDRAKQIIAPAFQAAPGDRALLALYERIARASGDKSLLLDFLVRRSASPECALDEIRQAIDLAIEVGNPEATEKLLERAYQIVRERESEGAAGQATWVFVALCEQRKQSGDVAGAIDLLRRASQSATDEQEALGYTRQLAELAAGPGGSLEQAAEAYQYLLERDRTDASIWRPLLAVYRQLGDPERFKKLVNATLDALLDLPLRCEVRMAYAEFLLDPDFLLDKADGEGAAIAALQEVLGEDPDHAQATARLIEIYQRNGNDHELVELLLQQFDRARDREDLKTVSELGLKIGGLLERVDPARAQEIYRAALEWVPQDHALSRALLAQLGPDADPQERAEILQRLLAAETGERAVALAEELLAIVEPLGDVERLQGALEQAHRSAPEHQPIRARLEQWYTEYGQWRPLAELLVEDGKRLGTSSEAVALFKKAAVLYREQLEDPSAATAALRQALALSPNDPLLLGEMLRASASAGEQRAAIEELGRLLDSHNQQDRAQADLLVIRAELWQSIGQNREAVEDIEQAYLIVGPELAPMRIKALVSLKNESAAARDRELERSTIFRLIQALQEAEDWHGANQTLVDWIERNPVDKDALHRLRAMDTAAERWEQVAHTCERLIEIEKDDALADAAIGMAEAYERAGRYDLARPGLEKAAAALPNHSLIRLYLRRLYEKIGAWTELVDLLRVEATTIENTQDKLASLLKIGQILLAAGDSTGAASAFEEARTLDPASDVIAMLLADTYTASGRVDDAYNLLNAAIEAHKRKRSPELALLQHRMARLAAACQDSDNELKWLGLALDTDSHNFDVAGELADAAIAAAKYDLAMKALRAITMVEESNAVLRAKAFYQQARIAHLRNDVRRAQHWARKAKSLDPNIPEIDAFLLEIGG